ncbi:hypothetical protein pdam_00004800 [Pocillopora damicornis]|uniref:DUF445 domain-containing protein n=1 Tax=Pocillopora damicornis TaxID=46731 RepID=A0A3M6U964_POCDA|nr:hypothetical protein pdam_00004800 [Pocillopora damicornis]
MATWPEANKKRNHARNATLELLSDGRSRHSKSAQASSRVTEFENLGLSVERDGQAMSDVSSFHSESLYSQHADSLRISASVPSHLSPEVINILFLSKTFLLLTYQRSLPNITIGCVSIVVTFFLFITVIKTACEVLMAAGLFGFTGGVTNWVGIKLIFNRIPGFGAIIKNFVTARKLMTNFILEAFFSPSQVRNYINDKKRTYLTVEQIDYQLEKLLNSRIAEDLIHEQLEVLMGTPEGLKLRMLGVTKAKLAPLVKPQLMKYKTHIVPLLLSSIESVDLFNADHLREQIVDLISTRTQELSAQQVKLLVEDAVYRHLSWIVFWGSVLGAVVGCAAELASVYINGT